MEAATTGDFGVDSFGIAQVGYEHLDLGFGPVIGAEESWGAYHQSQGLASCLEVSNQATYLRRVQGFLGTIELQIG